MSANPPSSKDPNTAMIIEIIAGYFGLLGIGHLYAGRTGAGLLRLFGWWALIIGVIFGSAVLSAFGDDGGILAVIALICLIPIILAAPAVSGLMLKRSMLR